MRKMKNRIISIIFFSVLFIACDNGGRGYEFMPDMYRSPSFETYGENKVMSDSLNAIMPVKGTVARGHLSTFNYGADLEDYLLSGKEAMNPFEKDAKNIEEGKQLYQMFCKHCHGENGAGGGTIQHPLYSAIPSYNDDKQQRRPGVTMSELKAGHIFHVITYGLNAMGPHASQINEEERWKIVLYVQELQSIKKEKQ